jgi:hypothetical protein
MAFSLASTDLVLEPSVIMLVLPAGQFASAEFIGAPIMMAITMTKTQPRDRVFVR